MISKICRIFQKKLTKLVEFTYFQKIPKCFPKQFWVENGENPTQKITLMLTHKRVIPVLKQGWLSYLARRLFSWLEIRVCFQLFDNKKFDDFFQKYSKLVRSTIGKRIQFLSISLSEKRQILSQENHCWTISGFFFKFLNSIHWRGSPALISIKWRLS